MLDGNDVIDLKSGIVVVLRCLAVFAMPARPLPDHLPVLRPCAPQEGVPFLGLILSVRRALDFRIDSRLPALT